ncbi:FadR/GntR family transcriptional regulator [Microvirga alba]|uniref:FadR family transcriptional regulator n=1 Tax=Microvirga alba TaxID=2791025 RepID=A0A931FNW5_9HYPH|nr:FCD domain-containing protein [Microvirga alba]MBF9234424.1 FadR family transcriptional regulator [Microvirga alba]
MIDAETPSDSSDFALRQLRALLDDRSAGEDKQLLPERALAHHLGVGRRTLRRALDVLEAEGRIWRHQGKGTFLGPRPLRAETSVEELSSRTNPLEVMEARIGIEPLLARLAALRASNGDIERLEHLARKTGTSAATDTDNRELWDGAFHRAIAEAANNSLLFAFIDVINQIRQDPTWRRLREQARSPAGQQTYVHYHHQIVAAIAARDGSAAEQAMREHLEAVRESLVKIMTRPATDNQDLRTANGQHSDDQGRPAA